MRSGPSVGDVARMRYGNVTRMRGGSSVGDVASMRNRCITRMSCVLGMRHGHASSVCDIASMRNVARVRDRRVSRMCHVPCVCDRCVSGMGRGHVAVVGRRHVPGVS